jgi:hypothetical protein
LETEQLADIVAELVHIAVSQPTPSKNPSQPELLAAFKGKIQPVRVSLAYRLAIGAVAILVVMLPVVYIGLMAAIAGGIWYHTQHNFGMVGVAGARAGIVMVFLYVAPTIAGVILLLFMSKPFFAPPARQRRIRSLRPNAEPLLFAFLQKICDSIGAPLPREVQVDHRVGVSARSGTGLRGLYTNELVLVIGAPLVAGLTTTQFAGELARELGHFSLGTGMRLAGLIQWLMRWFHRAVHDRDAWDEWLDSTTEDLDLRVAWIFFLAQACVWTTRGLLRLLEMVALLCCGFMLRQMEYHADLHQIRLVGSKTFEATQRRVGVFKLLFNSVLRTVAGTAPAAMVSNLPRMAAMVLNVARPEIGSKHASKLLGKTTQWNDTCPALSDRIAVGSSAAAVGTFQYDRGADCLFNDFDALARNVTTDFYHGMLGTSAATGKVMSPAEYLRDFIYQEVRGGEAMPRRDVQVIWTSDATTDGS